MPRSREVTKNSFDRIVANIRELSKLQPKVSLYIRVNIDKINMCEFVGVYNLMKSINQSIHVYPGYIREDVSSCKNSSCLNKRIEKREFLIQLFQKYGIYIPDMVPNINLSSCMARCINSFLIGPLGEMYKCWNHIGIKNMVIGNILDKKNVFTNTSLIATYMKGADTIDDPMCQSCKFLPLCGSGCAEQRLALDSKPIKSKDSLCCIFKNNIGPFLNIRRKFLYQYHKKEV